ncbi:signal recognition particle-docking protein FtsY [Candidatus Woesearchaeota archaeon]|nr:signal recognition particle-docking protein FtsY [Candidatus Woesearchaeota archaeon]
MFKFLKEKLKDAVSKFSKKVEEEAKEVVEEVEVKPKKEKQKKKEVIKKKVEKEEPKKEGFFSRLFHKTKEEPEEIKEKEVKEEKPKKEKAVEKKDEKEEIVEQPRKEEVKVQSEKEQAEEIKDEEVVEEEVIEEKEEVPEEVVKEERIVEEVKEEEEIQKQSRKKETTVEIVEETSEKKKEEAIEEEPEKKKGFFAKFTEKIVKKELSESKFEELFFELEMALLENNVASEVIEKIKDDMKKSLVDKPMRKGEIEENILKSLKTTIESLFDKEKFDLLEKIKSKKPYVICFFGINGSGKTTTIAKIARMLLDKKLSCVLAASDTFRAAAIDQLQLHADKLGVKLIKHDYGADAAAVAFDAVRHGEAKAIDVVLIDTAGRMHSNQNLIDELKKIVRVAKPDLKIFVGEAITGNDCVEQASKFNNEVGIDGIILTKADVDEKGGAFVSVSYVTKKPILFIGMGQEYSDLKPFEKDIVLENLGLET